MTKIRVSKVFRFEMAHALLGYEGLCRNIHGHSYTLIVTIAGEPKEDLSNPKNGMVMDFGELKKIVVKEIIQHFDHAFVLNNATPEKEKISSISLFEKILYLPFQPTCENILIEFAIRISKHLPRGITLHSLKLCETNDSFAEWHAKDNQ